MFELQGKRQIHRFRRIAMKQSMLRRVFFHVHATRIHIYKGYKQRGVKRFGASTQQIWGDSFSNTFIDQMLKKRHRDFKYVGCRRDICPIVQTSVQIWILGGSEGHRYREWSSDSPRIKAGRVGQSGKLVSLNNSSLN